MVKELPKPTCVRDVYDPAFELIRNREFGKQLYFRDVNKRSTPTDVAEMALALDQYELSGLLAFSSPDDTVCYLPRDSGVWAPVNKRDQHEIHGIIVRVSDLIWNHVIVNVKHLVSDLSTCFAVAASLSESEKTSLSESEKPQDPPNLKEAKSHLEELLKLYKSLRTPSFASSVVRQIVTIRVLKTRDESPHITNDLMNSLQRCLAFNDGIFDFRQQKLCRLAEAQQFYQTMTTRYDFDEMMLTRDDEGYCSFMDRILKPDVRRYLVDLFASSALNENRQVMVIHHNVSGSNGKSTLFALVKRAFGDLFVKCDSKMLAPSTYVSASGPNEELMSCRGKRIVLVSEPSTDLKLSSAFLKELTGGDEQSTRATYGKKQTFVFRGTLHVLCNKIPEVDDMCGGMQRRLRCIPYGSRFTDNPDDVNEEKRVFLRIPGLDEKFDAWKYSLMREIMQAAVARLSGDHPKDAPPQCVLTSTRDLIDRESTVASFVKTCLSHTGVDRDKLTLKLACDVYREYCQENDKKPLKKSDFKEEMVVLLGALVLSSNGMKNFWKGWAVC
jgi:P4 family phage/plasmid primase-like protien